jgi:hypothetical protein
MQDRDVRKEMSKAMSSLGRDNAAAKIAAEILAVTK